LPRIEQALETWRRYLLDGLPHPGRFEQHMVPMDELASATGPDLPTGTNRYLLRAVDIVGDIAEMRHYAPTPVAARKGPAGREVGGG
jgi:hypothetical protein